MIIAFLLEFVYKVYINVKIVVEIQIVYNKRRWVENPAPLYFTFYYYFLRLKVLLKTYAANLFCVIGEEAYLAVLALSLEQAQLSCLFSTNIFRLIAA